MKMKLKTLVPLSLLVVATGCASLGLSGSAEDVVEQRATRYMNSFLEKDFKSAYRFMTPGYRETHSYERFASEHVGMADMLSFEVTDVSCEENRCEVIVNRKQKPLLGILGSSERPMVLPLTNQQVWLYTDGNWYLYKR